LLGLDIDGVVCITKDFRKYLNETFIIIQKWEPFDSENIMYRIDKFVDQVLSDGAFKKRFKLIGGCEDMEQEKYTITKEDIIKESKRDILTKEVLERLFPKAFDGQYKDILLDCINNPFKYLKPQGDNFLGISTELFDAYEKVFGERIPRSLYGENCSLLVLRRLVCHIENKITLAELE
jgi:hypothetical protein